MTQLLGISGSLRAGSPTTKLVHAAAKAFGAPITLADLRLPLYDGDLEEAEGIPESVQTLADQIAAADAVLISTPEYNKAPPGVLKNALDWISRTDVKPWLDKPVALMSAAAGRAGGARGSYALRLAMTPFRARLLSQDVLVAGARGEFDENGRLTSERYDAQVAELVATLRKEVERS